MRRLLDIAEAEISQNLKKAASLAIEALKKALDERVEPDEVRRIASELHDLHDNISDLVMEAVARYSPVASDLRFLKSVLFVSYDLYRIARYAFDVSDIVKKLGEGCWSKRIEEVADVVRNMVQTAVEAFLSRDVSKIEGLEKLDDEIVDRKLAEALNEVFQGADRCKVVETVVLRLFERASDHAVYIGNHVFYFVTGKTRRR